MFEDFQQALEGAANIKDVGEFADIDKQFAHVFRAPVTQAVIGGIEDRASTANYNAQIAQEQELEKIKKEMQLELDKMDPEKYQRVVNFNDDGYDFFDPSGNPISAVEYAQATGKSVFDVLKNTSRQSQIDFLDDYGTMLDFNTALSQGEEGIKMFFEGDPESTGTDEYSKKRKEGYPELMPVRETLVQMNNRDLMDLLAQQYPEAFMLDAPDLPKPVLTGKAGENPVQKVLDWVTFSGSLFGEKQDYGFSSFNEPLTKIGNRYD